MPVEFYDQDVIQALGSAACLRVIPEKEKGRFLGALLAFNARGEPLEFAYNSVDIRHPFLWRRSDVKRFAARELAKSLFRCLKDSPHVLFALQDEVGGKSVIKDLQPAIPVCLLKSLDVPESDEPFLGDAALYHLPGQWIPALPEPSSPAGALCSQLLARGLVYEPLRRVMEGLSAAGVYAAREEQRSALREE